MARAVWLVSFSSIREATGSSSCPETQEQAREQHEEEEKVKAEEEAKKKAEEAKQAAEEEASAEAAGKKKAEEATAVAASKKKAEEGATAAAASKRKGEEEATARKSAEALAVSSKRTAEEESKASLKLGKARAAANSTVVRVTTSEAGVVTVGGPGLKTTVKSMGPGTHVITVPFTKAGKAARRQRKTIEISVGFKVGGRNLTSAQKFKL